ncbi:unnamed protein product [Calypogeia fissa]
MKCGALLRPSSLWQLRRATVGNYFRAAHSIVASQEPLSNDPGSSGADPYDVVIVGGGMVGAAVACGLASSHLTRSLRVAIVDGNPATKESYSPPKDAIPDSRVSAITPATVRFLQGIGAWETVLENRPAPFDSMQVWDYTSRGFTRYEAADVGEDVLGYVVENNVLISSLTSTLQRSDFAETICPARVKRVQFPSDRSDTGHNAGVHHLWEMANSQTTASTASTSSEETKSGQMDSGSSHSNDNWAHVILEDGRVLQSRLVVGADGGHSKVRAMANLKTSGWNYDQHALVCTVKVTNPHSTAWQRFLRTGPLALLPMGGHYSNIVWSTSPGRAKELKEMSQEEFVLETNRALTKNEDTFPDSQLARDITSKWLSPLFGDSPPSAAEPFHVPPLVTECLTPRLSFPLSLKHASQYVSTRLALVGDAAHTVHPLAGQGVNLGFGDAASLVKIIGDGVKTGADIGQLALLEKYEKDRMWANVPMMAVLDGFQRVFSADFLPVQLARAVGFNAANYVGPLKRQIISFAMGR